MKLVESVEFDCRFRLTAVGQEVVRQWQVFRTSPIAPAL